MTNQIINATVENRKVLRHHAKEAMKDYSPVMSFLLLDSQGNLYEIYEVEAEGNTHYVGNDTLIAKTGGFRKYHGDGAALDKDGKKYKTQRDYLIDLLGQDDYNRIFAA